MAMKLLGTPLQVALEYVFETGVWPSTIVMSDPFLKGSAKMPFTTRDPGSSNYVESRSDRVFADHRQIERLPLYLEFTSNPST
jgi:hypothetical protein